MTTTNGNGRRAKTTLTPVQTSEELFELPKEKAAQEKEQRPEVKNDPKHVTLNQDSTGIKKAALEQLENNPGIQPHQPSTGTESGWIPT